MMNTQIPKKQWQLLKTELHQAWEEISVEEIERTHGSVKSIYGLVGQKCELHLEEVKSKLTSLLKKYDNPESENHLL